MKSYDELKVKTEVNQQQMTKAKVNKLASVREKIKCLCNKFTFTAEILNSSFFEGQKKK